MTTPFAERLQAAEFHWFFIQGEEALEHQLYIPSCISFINGIEAGLRTTLHQLAGNGIEDVLGPTLSNSLLRAARGHDVPVGELAFPGERNFDEIIGRNTPYVELVRTRHNLAHGNIFGYIDREWNIFTPECVRSLAEQLLAISDAWTQSLAQFRATLNAA